MSASQSADAPTQLQAIDVSVWIAPSAQVFGSVAIGAGSSVWHNAVLRAECQQIRIGRMTNLQDFTMVHVGYDDATTIGDFCSIAHHATVHGCTLGDACLVGVGAVIMDGAVIGAGSIVAGGAVVAEGRRFEPGSVVAGVPAKAIAQRERRAERKPLNAWLYHRNAQFYREGPTRPGGPEYEACKRANRSRSLRTGSRARVSFARFGCRALAIRAVVRPFQRPSARASGLARARAANFVHETRRARELDPGEVLAGAYSITSRSPAACRLP